MLSLGQSIALSITLLMIGLFVFIINAYGYDVENTIGKYPAVGKQICLKFEIFKVPPDILKGLSGLPPLMEDTDYPPKYTCHNI